MSEEIQLFNEHFSGVFNDYCAHRAVIIDRALKEAVLKLEDGRMPSNEEISHRGRRVIYPNGKVEWYWDTTMILKEEPPENNH